MERIHAAIPNKWIPLKIKFVFIRVYSWLEITYG
jgi:hypothetical protein